MRENVGAIPIFINHLLDCGDLTRNLAEANLERPFFVGWMDVRLLWHWRSLIRSARNKQVKAGLGNMGYGGILLSMILALTGVSACIAL